MKEHERDSIRSFSFYSHNCIDKLPHYLFNDLCIKTERKCFQSCLVCDMKNDVLLQQFLFWSFTNKFGSVKYTSFYLTHRYFVCHPENVVNLWEEKLTYFKPNPTCWSKYSIWEPVPHELTLEHQFFLLSCLPNFQNQKWDKHVNITRFCQQFPNSCRFYAGSSRNHIIQAFFFKEESESVIKLCVKIIMGENTAVSYVNRKSKNTLDQKCDISFEIIQTALLYTTEDKKEFCM